MNIKVILMAGMAVFLWGSAFAAIRASLLGGYSAGHLVLFRFLIASFVFVLYFWVSGTRLRLPNKEDIVRILLLGWIGISVYQLGVTYGEKTVSAGTAGLLIASAPIFTALIATMALKEYLSFYGWLGMGVGFIGISLITFGSAGSNLTISTGSILLIIAAIAASIFFVYQKPLFKKYKPIELTAYFTWAGTIPFFIYFPGLIQEIQAATVEANLSAIYVGIFPAAVAYAMWAIALSLGEAGKVTSMIYIEPVFAIAVAWIWLHELPNVLSIIGGIIAVSSVFIINVLGKRKAAVERRAANNRGILNRPS